MALILTMLAAQIAQSQFSGKPPQESHIDLKIAFRQGLWHVVGQLSPDDQRNDISTVSTLSPTEAELCNMVASLVRPATQCSV
jgi:hypothetical protein